MSVYSKSYQLTKYPIGSISEMWTISWPLILGLMSSSLMMFVDRVLLAQYSIEALTASVNAGTAAYAIIIAPLTIAGISEVFVGQYHGHKKQYRMGEFTWQMIWLSIFLIPVFFVIAKYLPPYLFYGTGNEENETLYFSTLIYFASFTTVVPALMGYFAGQGKVKVITIAAILSNIVNCGLDMILIFGWNDFPEMGILGAAIATVTASIFQVCFFLVIFFSKKHRQSNGTTHFAFRYHDFIRCIKIGFPAGIAHASELTSHMAFFRLMIFAGPNYVIIASMMQSFYLLILFLAEGLSKSVIAISSNLIGASIYQPIGRVLLSAFRLQLIFAAIVFVVFFFFPEKLLQMMISQSNLHLLSDSSFVDLFHRTLFWVGCFFLIDGIAWTFVGLLTAAGDTRFIMFVGIVTQWLCYFTPVYFAICYWGLGVDKAWMLIALNALLLMVIYYLRVRHEKWKVIKI